MTFNEGRQCFHVDVVLESIEFEESVLNIIQSHK
jgi:hypothetical protein